MILSKDLKDRIREYKDKHPGVSSRSIATHFGVHHKTVNRVLRSQTAFKSWEPESSEKSEITADTWSVTLPKTRIHTLEELLEYCKVDLSVWEVERFTCNKYEVGMRPTSTTEYMDTKDGRSIPAWTREDKDPIVIPLFQVKAFLRKKKNVEAVKREIESP